MSDTRTRSRFDWSRLPLVGGIAYVVLMIAAGALFPTPPGGDVSSGHDPAWLAAHAHGVLMQDVIRGFAAVAAAALAFGIAARVRTRLPQGSVLGGLLVAGALIQAMLLVVAQGIDMGGAVAAAQVSLRPMVAFSSYLVDEVLDLTAVGWALYLLAAGIAILRTGAAPRLLGVFALAGTPLMVVSAAVPAVDAAYVLGPIGLLFTFVWMLASSITFLVVTRRGTAALTLAA